MTHVLRWEKISLAHFLVTVVVTGRRGGNERDPSSPPPSQLFARPIPTLQAKYSLKRTETPAIQAICLPLVVSILCGIAGAVSYTWPYIINNNTTTAKQWRLFQEPSIFSTEKHVKYRLALYYQLDFTEHFDSSPLYLTQI